MNIKEGRINISIAEAIAAVATIVSVSFTVILWSENRYQSKEEAKKIELAANDRLNKFISWL